MRRLLTILDRLRDAGVDHIVVGGVAVVLHGHPRLTVDLDLALDLASNNVLAALEVLAQEGLVPRLPVDASAFADPTIREGWVRDRHLIAFTLHDPSDARVEVDLLASTPVPYAELAKGAVVIRVGEQSVRVVSLEHLIAMKRSSGRPQDLADLAALQVIAQSPRLGTDERAH